MPSTLISTVAWKDGNYVIPTRITITRSGRSGERVSITLNSAIDLDMCEADAATVLRGLKKILKRPTNSAQAKRTRDITRLRSVARRANLDTEQIHESARKIARMSDDCLEDLGHADLAGQVRMLYESVGFSGTERVLKAAVRH